MFYVFNHQAERENPNADSLKSKKQARVSPTERTVQQASQELWQTSRYLRWLMG